MHNSNDPPPQTAERRRFLRGAVHHLARVECRKGSLGRGTNLAVAALDLSEAGIFLVTRKPLKKGQHVEIRLSACGLAQPARRLGLVVWSAKLAGAIDCAGVAFDKPLPSSEIQFLTR
jgi:hypothetical protein